MKMPLTLSALLAGVGLLGLSLTYTGASPCLAESRDVIGPPAPGVVSAAKKDKPAEQPEAATKLAAQSNNALAVAMYHELVKGLKDPGDNLFYSPTSITSALMLTYEGARRDTQSGFEKVLALKGIESRDQAHKSYAKMLGLLDGEKKPYELAVANALWGEKTTPFNRDFLATLNKHYDASLNSVDFIGNADKHRVEINDWVAKQTKDRIKDLLPKRSLNSRTRMVLVNALYFKSPWQVQFKKHMTREQPFYCLPEKQGDKSKAVNVPLMRHSAKRMMLADMDGYAALKMPYKRGDLSMVVLLPDDKGGLPALEKKLDAKLIHEALGKMKPQHVNIWLPKWKTTESYKLKKPLKALGMADAFSPMANFSGMSDSGARLFISEVYHKAFIEVDEAGTEAAAATAVVVQSKSAQVRPKATHEFRADHPFVYLIRDERSGAILFMGRVTDPS